jgi:flagellar transcriptional activator FlhD
MEQSKLIDEIREINLSYLLLAQHLLAADRDAAMYRLGIKPDAAHILERLTPAQVTRMAGLDLLLCRFRCDDRTVLSLLSGHGEAVRRRLMAPTHAALLLAEQPAAALD